MAHVSVYNPSFKMWCLELWPFVSTEQEGSEVLRLTDSSPKVMVESKEAGDESSENRVSLSSTTQHESLLEPNLEKIVPETSVPMQASVKKG